MPELDRLREWADGNVDLVDLGALAGNYRLGAITALNFDADPAND